MLPVVARALRARIRRRRPRRAARPPEDASPAPGADDDAPEADDDAPGDDDALAARGVGAARARRRRGAGGRRGAGAVVVLAHARGARVADALLARSSAKPTTAPRCASGLAELRAVATIGAARDDAAPREQGRAEFGDGAAAPRSAPGADAIGAAFEHFDAFSSPSAAEPAAEPGTPSAGGGAPAADSAQHRGGTRAAPLRKRREPPPPEAAPRRRRRRRGCLRSACRAAWRLPRPGRAPGRPGGADGRRRGRRRRRAAGGDDGRPSVAEHRGSARVGVGDFDLLRVVGRGAMGKVMLVRKRAGAPGPGRAGALFAMKILSKDRVAAKGQVAHTRSERQILVEIRHPYIVRLRCAFQSERKLYLVTDYYAGGALYAHLRRARRFAEPRARAHAAELCLALDHLHAHGIIYRDLKLENVLLGADGHVALADFGLSKENLACAHDARLTTFCGTAEYLAPELLDGRAYGAQVDWWAFGALLYEILCGRTPFFDRNRKAMFRAILTDAPRFGDERTTAPFSPAAVALLEGLLVKAPAERLGARGGRGRAPAAQRKRRRTAAPRGGLTPWRPPVDADLRPRRDDGAAPAEPAAALKTYPPPGQGACGWCSTARLAAGRRGATRSRPTASRRPRPGFSWQQSLNSNGDTPPS